MTLDPVQLDDLTWEDMVAAIRLRIPAESGGQWTLHAPVDPGVTLLELFAWQLEQRLYWLDQVPDALVVGGLRLLGLDAPQPARPAGTVLRVRADAGVTRVPAGTAFARDPLRAQVFTLTRTVTLLGNVGLKLWVDGRDRTADLEERRGVSLLPVGGGAASAAIDLEMSPPFWTNEDDWISLLLDLETTDGVHPQWSPDAVRGVPPPAEVQWYWSQQDERHRVKPLDIEDGTAGLRRGGVVRLRIPAEWRTPGPVRPHRLLVATDRATFSAPPRLRALDLDVSPAQHRMMRCPSVVERAALEEQIRGWRRLPGQHLDLPGAAGQLIDVRLYLRERGGLTRWRATPDLSFHGPGDRVFVIDRVGGALRFGNGLTGRIPVPVPERGWALLRVAWTVGGGAVGNGGTTGTWVALDDPRVAANNLVVAATGGRDPETIGQARLRAAAALRRRDRAVTADDHEVIAKETPGLGVQRAHAEVGAHPAYPCDKVPGAVTVAVLPFAVRGEDDWDRSDFVLAPKPDPGVLQAVRARLQEARLLGAEVFVEEPRYRATRLRVDIAGLPADSAGLRQRVRDSLRRFLDPLDGGDNRDGWPFGEPLRPSALRRVAQRAAGDDAEVAGVAIWVDGDPGRWEDCRDVLLAPRTLVAP